MSDTVTKRTLQKMRSALKTRLKFGNILDELYQLDIIDEERDILGRLETSEQVARLLDILERKDEKVISILINIIRHTLKGMKDLAQDLQREYAIARQPNGKLVTGKVVQIANIDENITSNNNKIIKINLQFLEDFLNKVGDKEMVILSVNGRMRRGKSFLCSNFLKYFLYGNNFEDKDWVYMSLSDEFIWKEDTERVTSGIHMFSEPLIIRQENKEIVVILLDCQGLFDDQTSEKGNALIFAFSILFSSVFVLNDIISTQDVFNNMNMFMQFAKAASSDPSNNQSKLIQKFIFLLRDWNNNTQYKYGYYDKSCKPEGQVNNLVDHLLGEKPNQTETAKQTRKAILDLSGEVGAAALPHPGKNPERTVDPTDYDCEFRNQIVDFICKIVSPDFIRQSVKRIGGNVVTGHELIKFLRIWVKALEDSKNLPNIQDIMATTIALLGTELVAKSQNKYQIGMENVLRNNSDGLSDSVFDLRHNEYLIEALNNFNSTTLLGGEIIQKDYEQKLRAAIEDIRTEKRTTNANNLRISQEREAARALAEQQRLQRVAAEKARAEAQKRAEEEKRLKQEAQRKQEEERVRREAAELEAKTRKDALIAAAQKGVEDSQKHLEWTQTNLAQVRSNIAAFEYYVTEYDKERTSFLGFNASPRYVPRQAKKFNQAGYNSAVQRAESDVQQAGERLAAANLSMQIAQSS